MHKSPGSLRPPPWLGRAIEDLVRAIQGEIVSQCGFAVSTQGVSLGDDLLAVHEPTRIESFTERTERMAHTTLLLSPCPLKRGDAAQRLGEKRSKMHTKKPWQACGGSRSVHTAS
jgi:hypothetical protein